MYEFSLHSVTDGTSKELQIAPVGWDDIKRSILKDKIYFGIFKTITVELKFIYDGWDYLFDQFARYGVNANIILFVRKNNKHLLKGKVNFKDYDLDLDERTFKIDIIQSDFIQKFTTRDELELNILNGKAVDGEFVSPATLVDVTLRNQIIPYHTECQLNESATDPIQYPHTWPIEPVQNDNPNVQFPFYIDTLLSGDIIDSTNGIYVNQGTDSQEVKFEYSYSIQVQGGTAGPAFVQIDLYDSDDNLIEDGIINVVYSSTGQYSKSGTFTRTIPSGAYLLLWVFIIPSPGAGFTQTTVEWISVGFDADEDSVFENTICKYVLPHELFSNLTAQMTGKQNAFYSDIFGRTDLGYAEDGEAAYDARTIAELMRGFELNETELSMSFRDAFVAYSSEYCLGAMIIDDVVHIDRIDTLFNNQKILDIGEVQKLHFGPAEDYMFNSVKIGYEKIEFENVNGVNDPHSTSVYTNDLVPFKKELNLVSKHIKSGLAHELTRRAQKSIKGTEDTKFDGEIFGTRLAIEEDPFGIFGKTYTNERQEKIDYAIGILSPETTFNLYTVPSQNLYRWRKYLGIPIYKSQQKYFYQTKDKNSQLQVGANTPDGLVETKESGDIDVIERYFVPEKANFDAPLTREILLELLSDPLQIIRFKFKGVIYDHYLYEINTEDDSNKGSWNTLAIRSFARKESPVNYDLLAIIKHGEGENDYLKHGDGEHDYILYE